MKTENTPQNKEKFFALYINQKIMTDVIGNTVELKKSWNWKHESFFLQLKPLSKISDEECLFLSKNIFRFTQLKVEENIIKEIKRLLEFNGQTNISQSEWLKCFDYLRSKSFALPYKDLELQDLIDYGWIKLEN